MMENKYTCLLVEDDAMGIEMLQDYINRRNDLTLLATGSQLSEVEQLLNKYSPSIIFLDLIIPYGEPNNFSYNKIPDHINTIIISAIPLSHYNGELPSGEKFELLKPISFEHFNRCVDSVIKNLNLVNG
ncbi:hypothetical protein [Sphingobacterium sp.]|uniref:hypothetical protein n=1 Tax=Sphingobacterium sp. TaxID=341027 RepID=UPI0031E3E6EF